jgi:light-regulated signal transduction histidine kinase (bacteriophytochrome)
MVTRKMVDYRVRIQVAEDSPDGVLLDFLKHERHPSFSHKEMVLWALRGYWMAIAFRQRSELGDNMRSEAQIQRMALDAVHQLRQQINYIQVACNVQEHKVPSGSENEADYREEKLGKFDKKLENESLVRRFAEQVSMIEKSPIAQDGWYEGDDLFDSSV